MPKSRCHARSAMFVGWCWASGTHPDCPSTRSFSFLRADGRWHPSGWQSGQTWWPVPQRSFFRLIRFPYCLSFSCYCSFCRKGMHNLLPSNGFPRSGSMLRRYGIHWPGYAVLSFIHTYAYSSVYNFSEPIGPHLLTRTIFQSCYPFDRLSTDRLISQYGCQSSCLSYCWLTSRTACSLIGWPVIGQVFRTAFRQSGKQIFQLITQQINNDILELVSLLQPVAAWCVNW